MSRETRRKKAASIRTGHRPPLHTWPLHHLQVALSSLSRLARTPLSTLLTSAVIGIALALPTGLHLIIGHVEELSGSWDGAATISLYLQPETDSDAAQEFASELSARPEIDGIRLISREQALDEFRRLSGFSEAIDSLGTNPLPPVIVIEPAETFRQPGTVTTLLEALQNRHEVDIARLDLQWVRRFHALTDTAHRAVLVLASLLGTAVLLIVVNTIRLEIQNRHAEIEIMTLVGATNGFVRRPFLYNGLWYGLLGGLISWLLVMLSLWLLDGPVARLAKLYSSDFGLNAMSFDSVMYVMSISVLLGLGGSWLAVSRHLKDVEPG